MIYSEYKIKRIVTAILYFFIFCFLSLSILSLYFLPKIPFPLFKQFIIINLSIPTNKQHLLTIELFNKFILYSYIFPSLLIIISLLIYFFKNWLSNNICQLVSSFILFILTINDDLCKIRKDNYILLFITFIVFFVAISLRLFFLYQPIRGDEAGAFLIYGIRPAYLCLTYYHAPNNHIFHSLLIHFSYLLFGNSLFAIRFPALMAGIFIVSASYIVSRLFYNKYSALLTAAFVSTSSILIEYSTNSRGYSLITLISLSLFGLGYYLIKHNNLSGWFIFGTLSAIGFYTIPVMLYPYGIVIIWLFIIFIIYGESNNYINIKYLIISILTTCLITLIFYTPIFLVSGIRSVISNDFVKPLEINYFIKNIPRSLLSTFELWQRDLPKIMSGILLIGFIVSMIYFRKIFHFRANIFFATILWLVPILIFQRVIPFPRVWLFLLPMYLLLACSGLTYLILKVIPEKNNIIEIIFYSLTIIILLINSYFIITNKSILMSTETGVLRDAETITFCLKDKLSKDTRIIACDPSDIILKYYFFINNISLEHFDFDLKSLSDGKIFAISNKAHKQDIGHVLRKKNIIISQYVVRELQNFDSATLYEIYKAVSPPSMIRDSIDFR